MQTLRNEGATLMKSIIIGFGFIAVLTTFADFPSASNVIQVSDHQVLTEGGQERGSEKFDEFVITRDFSIDDAKARMDAFYDDGLKNKPTFLAYVILYRGKCRWSRYTLRATKKYLMLRGLSAGRIRTVDGGYRDEPTMELWIVPQGGQPPRPTPTYRSKRWRC